MPAFCIGQVENLETWEDSEVFFQIFFFRVFEFKYWAKIEELEEKKSEKSFRGFRVFHLAVSLILLFLESSSSSLIFLFSVSRLSDLSNSF